MCQFYDSGAVIGRSKERLCVDSIRKLGLITVAARRPCAALTLELAKRISCGTVT